MEDFSFKEEKKKQKKAKKLEGTDNLMISLEKGEKKTIKVQPKLPFSVWFNRKLQKNEVKYWQESALLVYMQKQGLGSAEVEDQYNEALKKF